MKSFILAIACVAGLFAFDATALTASAAPLGHRGYSRSYHRSYHRAHSGYRYSAYRPYAGYRSRAYIPYTNYRYVRPYRFHCR